MITNDGKHPKFLEQVTNDSSVFIHHKKSHALTSEILKVPNNMYPQIET